MGRLEVAILVIRQRRQMDEPFDERVGQLDEQAVRADTGHVTVELLADPVRHEADLLPLHQFALGLGRAPLPLRRVLRHGRQFVLEGVPPRPAQLAAPDRAQEPMHDEVGVPPDGRGEVGVRGHRESEVARVDGVVAGLRHGPQHQERDGARDGRAGHAIDELLEVPGPHGAGRRAEGVAERRDEGLEDLDLRRIGGLVDAVDRGHLPPLQFRRDGLVGEQHELLDEAVRVVALGRGDGLDLPFLVQPDLGLGQVEVDRSPAPAAVTKPLEQAVHVPQHRDDLRLDRPVQRRLPGQDGVHARVRQPGAAADDAVVELDADRLAARVDLDHAGLHEPIDAGIEAAQAGGQLGREHVDRAIGEVDRRAAVARVVVQGAAGLRRSAPHRRCAR